MSSTVDSQSIASQTWRLIEETNASLAQSAQSQQKGQGAISAGNRVVNLQHLEKDIILPSDGQSRQDALIAAKDPAAASKPPLPYPGFNSKAFQGTGDDHQMGLIAIIGAVLALQAKTNSNFWSTLWQQASQSMQMQVSFAPIVGSAIKSQYQAQSDATLEQSAMQRTDGIINLCMFGGAMVMGAVAEFQDPAEVTNPEDPAAEFEEEENAPSAAEDAAEENPVTEEQQLDRDTDQVLNDENKANESRGSKAGQFVKSRMGVGQARLSAYLGRGMQMMQGAQMLSSGSTALNDSTHQAQIAVYQAQEGQCAAVSQEGQIYSQFYGQDFSRNEDLRQGSGQMIDYAMNILQQAANSITQTVTSMFRG